MGDHWEGQLSGPNNPGLGPVVFLDRDGVLTAPVIDSRSGRPESPYRPEDVRLMGGAAAALRVLRGIGATLVLVSNQPAAAKGTCSLADLDAVHAEFSRLLAVEGLHLDVVRYCHHHPEATVPALRGPCACRKPAPGLLVDAVRELGFSDFRATWMIGDSDVDIAAGKRVGARTILIEEPLSAHRRTGSAAPDHRAPSVLSAAQIVADAVGHPRPEDA